MGVPDAPDDAPKDGIDRRFSSALDDFLTHIQYERGLSTNTSEAYRRDLKAWGTYCSRIGVEPLRATSVEVSGYLERLRAGDESRRALAPSSVARTLVSLRGFYRFGTREGLTNDDPTLKIGTPARTRSLPKALREDEVDLLLGAPGDDLLGWRDRAILASLYGSGMRISELVMLDIDDVDEDSGTVLIRSGKGSKSRIVPLGQAVQAIQAYGTRSRPTLAARGDGAPALFLNARGKRLTRQGCWKVLKDQAAKVSLEDKVSPHTLRHSCATHMLDHGADIRVVQELLGHASLATTQVYTLVTDRRLREVYLAAHPRAGG